MIAMPCHAAAGRPGLVDLFLPPVTSKVPLNQPQVSLRHFHVIFKLQLLPLGGSRQLREVGNGGSKKFERQMRCITPGCHQLHAKIINKRQ